MRPYLVMPLILATATAIGCSQKLEMPDVSNAEPQETVAATADSAPAEPPAPASAAIAPTATEATATEVAAAPTLPAVYVQEGVAIAGADPVAYFTQSAYVPGSNQFTHEWSGATWYFASAENRDAFASNPVAYAPQYGGFCAWAVSQGYSAPVDPTAWKIVNDKLYLNYDSNVQARWERDIPGNIAKADTNWPEVAASE